MSVQSLKHNPNGRFVVVCGDGEYIIYTALAWRNRSFGSALEFAWASDGEYAVRESTSKIKIFNKSFQVHSDVLISTLTGCPQTFPMTSYWGVVSRKGKASDHRFPLKESMVGRYLLCDPTSLCRSMTGLSAGW